MAQPPTSFDISMEELKKLPTEQKERILNEWSSRIAAAKDPAVTPDVRFGNRARGAPVTQSAHTNTYTNPAHEAQYSGPPRGPRRGSYRGRSAFRGATRFHPFRHHPYVPPQHQRYQNRTATFIQAGPLVTEQDSARNTTLCRDFTSTGICIRPECPYVHDQNKVAICKAFLFKDNCAEGDDCPLSHIPTTHNTVACNHFRKGNCTKGDCHFAHIHVGASVAVCEVFSRLGYCEKGDACVDRHAFDECPDYTNKGACKAGAACRLTHVRHAARLRKAHPSADAESPLSLSSENETMDVKAPTDFLSNEFDAPKNGSTVFDLNVQFEFPESDKPDSSVPEVGPNPDLSLQADFVAFDE